MQSERQPVASPCSRPASARRLARFTSLLCRLVRAGRRLPDQGAAHPRRNPAAGARERRPAHGLESRRRRPAPSPTTGSPRFNDAQLNALVSEAIANNPDLRVAATRVEQAAQYVELAKAALRPAVNLFGTRRRSRWAAAKLALQVLSLGAVLGARPVGPLALWPQRRSGNLRLGAGRFRIRPAVPRRHDGQELVHRQRNLAAAADCRRHGEVRAATAGAGREAPASRRRQRAGRRAGARQPRHLPGQRQADPLRARADAARPGTAARPLSRRRTQGAPGPARNSPAPFPPACRWKCWSAGPT